MGKVGGQRALLGDRKKHVGLDADHERLLDAGARERRAIRVCVRGKIEPIHGAGDIKVTVGIERPHEPPRMRFKVTLYGELRREGRAFAHLIRHRRSAEALHPFGDVAGLALGIVSAPTIEDSLVAARALQGLGAAFAVAGNGPKCTQGPDALEGSRSIQPGSTEWGFSSRWPLGCSRPLFRLKISINRLPLPSVAVAMLYRVGTDPWPGGGTT